MKKVNVVLFDFDGTLSWPDSNIAFARYCFGHSLRPWIFLPIILGCACARYLNRRGVWWRENVRLFLTPGLIKRLAPEFAKLHLKNRFGWAAERVAAERAAGNKVLLVSASPDYLMNKLLGGMEFDGVLCSKTNKKKPWKYEFMCWGQNKVIALDAWAKKNKCVPHVVRAYSDSKSDMPMMEIADQQIWIDPKSEWLGVSD